MGYHGERAERQGDDPRAVGLKGQSNQIEHQPAFGNHLICIG
jgi:hypothetical protein